MNQITPRQELTVALLLLGLMVMTRFHHFGSVIHLPDASWAVFIAAGFFLRRAMFFLLFMGAAVLVDVLAITQFGVSSFCISSAYGFLVPAYGALWLGGRWLSANLRSGWAGLASLAAMVVVSVSIAFLISSGSFYWLSGTSAETSLAGFMKQSVTYFPSFLQVTAIYVAAIAVVYWVVDLLRKGQLPSSHRHV